MFTKSDERESKSHLFGIKYKTLAFGERTSLSEFSLAKGSIIPTHKHPHEQTGYVISGRMIFTIGGERFEAKPGDGWNIPSNMEHDVEVLEDTVVIEVFSPAREEYLP
ncbi:MAG: cupin domain-containing protein [Candidatus Aminicenantes bacterium]|nr:MAG: cupin domain-containing protein [Candidatus Aminicenantes bacterium]